MGRITLRKVAEYRDLVAWSGDGLDAVSTARLLDEVERLRQELAAVNLRLDSLGLRDDA